MDISSARSGPDADHGSVGRTTGGRALFLDWGGTLTRLRDNRTLADPEGNPVLMPGIVAVLDLAVAHGISLAESTHVGDSDKDRAAAGILDFRRAADFFGWH